MAAEPRTTMARRVGRPSQIGQQLQRADDVDVVQRRARAAGLGELDDVVVDHRVDRRGAYAAAAGRGCAGRPRRRRCARRASGSTGRVSTPTTRSTPASAASRRASRAPNAFATPVMRTRRPATRALRSGRGAGGGAGRRLWPGRPAAWPARSRRRGAPARAPASSFFDAASSAATRSRSAASSSAARGPQVLERLAEAPGGGHSSSASCWARSRVKPAWPAVASMACAAAARTASPRLCCCFLSAAGPLLLLAGVLLGQGATSLSSPAVAHLHPTAELAERALLPDDPGPGARAHARALSTRRRGCSTTTAACGATRASRSTARR